jgi:hypothetical protein
MKPILKFLFVLFLGLYVAIPSQAQIDHEDWDNMPWRVNINSGFKNELFRLNDPMNLLSLYPNIYNFSAAVFIEKKVGPKLIVNSGLRRSTISPYHLANATGTFIIVHILDRVSYYTIPIGVNYQVFKINKLVVSGLSNFNFNINNKLISIDRNGAIYAPNVQGGTVQFHNQVRMNPFLQLSAEYGFELSRSLGERFEANLRFSRTLGFWAIMKSTYTYTDENGANLANNSVLQSNGSGRYHALGIRYFLK